MYTVTRQFLAYTLDFFTTVLSYEIIAGITLKTVFLFNFLLVVLVHTFSRR